MELFSFLLSQFYGSLKKYSMYRSKNVHMWFKMCYKMTTGSLSSSTYTAQRGKKRVKELGIKDIPYKTLEMKNIIITVCLV